MNVKTFVYDVRGYSDDLASQIDADYAAWHATASPTSVDDVQTAFTGDSLVILVYWTT